MFLRIDRAVTLYFVHPIKRVLQCDSKDNIPILMYHSISGELEEDVHPYYRTNTSPEVFGAHMKYLHGNGYSVINLEMAAAHISSKDKISKKIAVVTFDDGLHNFITAAFPVLRKYDFTASVFLPTSFIDSSTNFFGQACLSWDDVRKLHSEGISFGSHTVHHPILKELSREDVEIELSQSKEIIEKNTGTQVDSFSYPFAFPDDDQMFIKDLLSSLKKCGYKYGVSTRIGTTSNQDNILCMKRIPVNSFDDIELFKAKLEGGYNWLAGPQYVLKAFKKYFRATKIRHN